MKRTFLTLIAIGSIVLTSIILASEANAQEVSDNIWTPIQNSEINNNKGKHPLVTNDEPITARLTKISDNFYDTGGASGEYTNNEFQLWLIEPLNAKSITIDFTLFSIEDDYDNLFIYDGNSINSPLIGRYTGSNSPGTIVSSSGALLIEFRSDCSTLSSGWIASYSTSLYDFSSAKNPNKSVSCSSGLVYRVQIGAFSNSIPKYLFNEFSPISSEKVKSGNIIRYMTGSFKSSDAVINAKTQIRALGYSDAFAVAYYNGKRINFNEARKREVAANEMMVDLDY
jgi:hypothetical protein